MKIKTCLAIAACTVISGIAIGCFAAKRIQKRWIKVERPYSYYGGMV